MALTVQRTPEIKSNTANEGTRTQQFTQQAVDTIKREVQIQDQSVLQTNKTEQNNVDRDGRGSGGYAGRRGKGKKKQDEEKQGSQLQYNGRLDVSV
jgi:hypothetical protein